MSVGYSTQKGDLTGAVAQIQLLTEFGQDGGYKPLELIKISPVDDLYGPLTQNGATALGVTALGANETEAVYAAQKQALDDKVKQEPALAEAVVQGLEKAATDPSANSPQLTAFFEGHNIAVDNSNGFAQEIEAYKKQIGLDLHVSKKREYDIWEYARMHQGINGGGEGIAKLLGDLFKPEDLKDGNDYLVAEVAVELVLRAGPDGLALGEAIDDMKAEGIIHFSTPEEEATFREGAREKLQNGSEFWNPEKGVMEKTVIGKNEITAMKDFMKDYEHALTVNIPTYCEGVSYDDAVKAHIDGHDANGDISVKGADGKQLFTLPRTYGDTIPVYSVASVEDPKTHQKEVALEAKYEFTASDLANKLKNGDFEVSVVKANGGRLGYKFEGRDGTSFILGTGVIPEDSMSDSFKNAMGRKAPAPAPEAPTPNAPKADAQPSAQVERESLLENMDFSTGGAVNNMINSPVTSADNHVTAPTPFKLPGAA